MRTLIEGMLDFRKNEQASYQETYAHLAEGQAPKVLFITCSDSRISPHMFASANPGETFIIRNMGNIIPEASSTPLASAEAASLEFSLSTLPIKHIIVCGHYGCGAMQKVLSGFEDAPKPIKGWLNCCGCDPKKLGEFPFSDKSLSETNQLVQMNVLKQIEHLKTHPAVQEKLALDSLSLHGWYYDIPKGDVYHFSKEKKSFVLLDEEECARLLKQMETL